MESQTPHGTSIPAAEYVRMSTEHQQYSIDNQQAAIRSYAIAHNFEIVKTYDDAGCSGATLKNRLGLKQLLEDVVKGTTEYRAILVYDISRWGRFPDVDEAAHYEFLCKKAGVPVHYCAEPFTNDGTPSAAVLKALKRSMAAEYSRELGMKVTEGQRRLIALGFRTGGIAGYGLRRMLISADGKRRKKLESGEYKYIKTDRIVLVPGPKREVQTVQRIFEMARKWNCAQIARRLNQEGIRYLGGEEWNYDRVWKITRNPKYAGVNVWGRTIQSLARGSLRRSRPPEFWVSKTGAFRPIISPQQFARVQGAIQLRKKMRDKSMLEKLRNTLKAVGNLSGRVIKQRRGMPSLPSYVRHFGGICRAYELIGYRMHPNVLKRVQGRRESKALREKVMHQIETMFPGHIKRFSVPSRAHVLQVDGTFNVSVIVGRYYETPGQHWIRWQLFPRQARWCSAALVCLSNKEGTGFNHFSLMRTPNMDREYQVKGAQDPWLTRGLKLRKLSDFYPAVLTFDLRKEVEPSQRSSPRWTRGVPADPQTQWSRRGI